MLDSWNTAWQFVEELMYGHLRKEQLVKSWEADLGDTGGRLLIDVTRKLSRQKG